MRCWLIPRLVLVTLVSSTITASLHAAEYQRIVFGSFSTPSAAQSWAAEVAAELDLTTEVLAYANGANQGFRVASHPLPAAMSLEVQHLAGVRGWPTWHYPVTSVTRYKATSSRSAPKNGAASLVQPPVQGSRNSIVRELSAKPQVKSAPKPAAEPKHNPNLVRIDESPARNVEQEFDLDVGVQSRSYVDRGNAGQDRWQVSTSISLQWQRSWLEGQRSLTATPFLRVDSQDSERTHFDMRELFASAIGNNWELHLGARRVFWGVTEFHHLVDVINQTDLVENIDTEDKLGQPMVQLSLVRDWGIVDFMLLTGFRERTFPGDDGRLRALLPIDTDHATYASAAQQQRIDGAVRWSHTYKGIDFGVYHFSGTNRDPQLHIVALGANAYELRPHYTTIDQSGLDAQVNLGDWAFKLEAISRSGDGERYAAANLGLERTLVGAFGSRSDLGLVLEYMFDERGDEATNTFFEHDLAIGARWQLNDLYDSQALLGVIWDTKSDETVVSLEANRRLGEYWQLALEARVFAGAQRPEQHSLLALLADPEQKTSALQRDDFLQLEFTRFF